MASDEVMRRGATLGAVSAESPREGKYTSELMSGAFIILGGGSSMHRAMSAGYIQALNSVSAPQAPAPEP